MAWISPFHIGPCKVEVLDQNGDEILSTTMELGDSAQFFHGNQGIRGTLSVSTEGQVTLTGNARFLTFRNGYYIRVTPPVGTTFGNSRCRGITANLWDFYADYPDVKAFGVPKVDTVREGTYVPLAVASSDHLGNYEFTPDPVELGGNATAVTLFVRCPDPPVHT